MSNTTAIVIPTMDNPFRNFVLHVDEIRLFVIAIFVGILLMTIVIAIADKIKK